MMQIVRGPLGKTDALGAPGVRMKNIKMGHVRVTSETEKVRPGESEDEARVSFGTCLVSWRNAAFLD